MKVTIEYPYGFIEQVEQVDARAKIEESAAHDTPIKWETDEWGEKATQYFAGENRFVGCIYRGVAAEGARLDALAKRTDEAFAGFGRTDDR